MELIELNEKEFVEFASNFPYSMFFQSPEWIKVKEKNGWEGKIVGIKEKNEIIAASVILLKNIKFINQKMAYAPRGFLLDYNDLNLLTLFTNKIKDYLKNQKVFFLKINPYVKYQERDINGKIIDNIKNDKLFLHLRKIGFCHHGFYVKFEKKNDLEPRWLSILELNNETSDSLFKKMRTTTKRWIKNSEKNSLRIIECQRDDLVEFKSLMEHTAERREFIDRSLSYYQNIYDVMSKNNLVKFLLVEINFKNLLNKTNDDYNNILEKIKKHKDNLKKEKEIIELENEKKAYEKRINDLKKYISEYGNHKIIAGGLYMLYGKQVVYLLGASYKDFMKYNSQYLLQWHMIKYALEHHYQTFNFYGIDGNFNNNSKYYGLFDFKRGFGCDVVELIGEFDLVINRFLYNIYRITYSIYHSIKKIITKIKKISFH